MYFTPHSHILPLRHHVTSCISFFFFNDTPTTEIYTLSLHDALPICSRGSGRTTSSGARRAALARVGLFSALQSGDRKSTRLNSSHVEISYAVFCLKKKTTCTIIGNFVPGRSIG